MISLSGVSKFSIKSPQLRFNRNEILGNECCCCKSYKIIDLIFICKRRVFKWLICKRVAIGLIFCLFNRFLKSTGDLKVLLRKRVNVCVFAYVIPKLFIYKREKDRRRRNLEIKRKRETEEDRIEREICVFAYVIPFHLTGTRPNF